MLHLPKEINDTTTCYALVNNKAVDGGPDLVTCNTNGYMYEIKNKKLLRSLNLNESAITVSCHYLLEKENVIIFYLVLTARYRLLIIRRTSKHLKVVEVYERVREFQVFDFNCLGFPQIKVSFMGEGESTVCYFPVGSNVNEKWSKTENSMVDSLAEDLWILNKHIDDLTEEHDQLRKLCFFSDLPVDVGKILVGPVAFSLLNEAPHQQLIISHKWHRVYGADLILGVRVQNVSDETVGDAEVALNHPGVRGYSWTFFQGTADVVSLLSSRETPRVMRPGEEAWAVGALRVPDFVAESKVFVSLAVVSSDLKICLAKETFELGVWDVAAETTEGLEERFTVEDLMALMVVKRETRVRIGAEGLEGVLMEALFIKNLGFKKVNRLKDNLFYCTSTYLKEVFVSLEQVAANPNTWLLVMFTSESCQIYFLINALYDLLPENSAILLEES